MNDVSDQDRTERAEMLGREPCRSRDPAPPQALKEDSPGGPLITTHGEVDEFPAGGVAQS